MSRGFNLSAAWAFHDESLEWIAFVRRIDNKSFCFMRSIYLTCPNEGISQLPDIHQPCHDCRSVTGGETFWVIFHCSRKKINRLST
jgi:hypothetical protein